MAKMWSGRTDGVTEKIADDFNSSISFDKRLYKQDVSGSIAHACMLAEKNIISHEDADQIVDGLSAILEDLENGKLAFDMDSEDIHMFIEQELTKRIGDVGKKLHTARSRNDQVALDLRLYLLEQADDVLQKIDALLFAIIEQAEANVYTIMPGYTHLQRAQPISFAHHLLAYANMFLRDKDRIVDCKKRIAVSPIGCCALAGTTYDTDRVYEAKILGLDKVAQNSIDGVSDRDFCVEFVSTLAMVMMHLSRFSEEIILWSSWEFSFVELSDAFTTGSSIMPQKKNSDMAELVRGKTGRVYGNLTALLTMLKGLPLAYNKDMQEDKESVFDSIDTVKACLDVFAPMVKTMKAKKENMENAAKKGFINATDLADYLTKKGMPFRSAYKLAGSAVAKCIKENKVLEDISLDQYKQMSELFDSDVYDEISLKTCVEKRNSLGGTSFTSVKNQINEIKGILHA